MPSTYNAYYSASYLTLYNNAGQDGQKSKFLC